MFRLVLSEKFQPSVLVVPCDEKTSRLYSFQKESKDASVRYFRCLKCRQLNREFPVPGQSATVVVRINGDQLEAENTTHHHLCMPTCNDWIRSTQIHRSCKLLVKEGSLTAMKAFEKAVILAATDGASVLAQLGTWQQMSRAYYAVASQGFGSRKRHNVDSSQDALVKRPLGSVDSAA